MILEQNCFYLSKMSKFLHNFFFIKFELDFFYIWSCNHERSLSVIIYVKLSFDLIFKYLMFTKHTHFFLTMSRLKEGGAGHLNSVIVSECDATFPIYTRRYNFRLPCSQHDAFRCMYIGYSTQVPREQLESIK